MISLYNGFFKEFLFEYDKTCSYNVLIYNLDPIILLIREWPPVGGLCIQIQFGFTKGTRHDLYCRKTLNHDTMYLKEVLAKDL